MVKPLDYRPQPCLECSLGQNTSKIIVPIDRLHHDVMDIIKCVRMTSRTVISHDIETQMFLLYGLQSSGLVTVSGGSTGGEGRSPP